MSLSQAVQSHDIRQLGINPNHWYVVALSREVKTQPVGVMLWKQAMLPKGAAQGAFSEEQIRELLHDLLPVLHFVHQQQVIHRDIKPTNILRRKIDGKLVLIDFGVAKVLTVGSGLTRTGTKAGTEGYAAIEQMRTGKAYAASDLYSLGVTCIHLLTQVELDELYDPLEGKWLWREHLRQKVRYILKNKSRI